MEKPARTKQARWLTAIIRSEGDGFVALCPELDVASQGTGVEAAHANLKEALELFLESADPEEIEARPHDDVFVTHVEVANPSNIRAITRRPRRPKAPVGAIIAEKHSR